MNIPDNLKYAATHEWVRSDDDDIVTIGISDYAQAEMTELVYVELPDVGRQVKASEEVAVVESVKSASDIYSPVSGEVVEVNTALSDNPALVNESPFDNGWLFKLKLSQPDELNGLLDAASYKAKISD
ncbi:MAG: glycine cleavage system protein GcvH [Planctomycetaceae bacterium]